MLELSVGAFTGPAEPGVGPVGIFLQPITHQHIQTRIKALTGQLASVRGEGQLRTSPVWPTKVATSLQMPTFQRRNGLVVLGAGKQLSVGAERDVAHHACVTGQRLPDRRSSRHVPQPDGLIGRCGRRCGAVSAERQPVHDRGAPG
jgi:hypothetical protein